MSIEKFIPASQELFVYADSSSAEQSGATTMALMQTFMKNNSDLLACLIETLWQPSKTLKGNVVIWSPGMAPGLQAIVTQPGTTNAVEPVWATVAGGTTTDGTVIYKMTEISPKELPASGGTANIAKNAEKLGDKLPSFYGKQTDVDLKAPLESPAFTGKPVVPTALAGSNTKEIANCDFVAKALSALTLQGKIVAYSLAPNGYVTFDIGLTIQWGISTTTYTTYYPMAFRSAPFALFVQPYGLTNYSDIGEIDTPNITNTNFYARRAVFTSKLFTYPFYGSWLAIGV